METPRIHIGVSQCLLGDEVRFDGGHKRDGYITGMLGTVFCLVPVCPEVEAGFGIPRESMRLEGDPATPRLISHRTRRDLTRPLVETCESIVARLAGADLHGFVLKGNSPSCGMEKVRVQRDAGLPDGKGIGLFARRLRTAMPLLPVTEEGRLGDAALRENFITRIFVHHRWQTLLQEPSARELVAFHSRHKFLLMAHSPVHMRRMGQLIGNMTKDNLPPWEAYGALLMEAMGRLATPGKHVDAILHMMGFLKKHLTNDEKAEMLELLTAYKKGDLPRLVPITLLNHHVRQFDLPYLAEQWYLQPHPLELRLCNHA
ncbi:MAG: DUF523 and DUF1722 domain-containing protein [Magnetococcales bacterium]|nr:DUF523 and DUF1722 domain-containing protein [Magnetococcales bacterium]